MSDRFADLKKIPDDPARRFLALANSKLSVPLTSPANASVSAVLRELEAQSAKIDMLKLLAMSLPPREAIWWGCLAAEDLLENPAEPTPALKAARAWVFKPTDEAREAARLTTEEQEPGDDTTLLATAVSMWDGKLKIGDMDPVDAAPGLVGNMIFAINTISMASVDPDDMADHTELLIDRALDIARGGNGQVQPRQRIEETT